MNCDSLGHHWGLLKSLLPLYQAITLVRLGDGSSTLFWTDVWWGDEPLEDRFPRLFSHCIKPLCMVQDAISDDLQGHFVNRMSPEALLELERVQRIMQETELSEQPDTRLSVFSRSNEKLDTSAIYRLLKARGQHDDPASTFIWKNAAPPRVQLFLWLLIRGRVQCRANLHRKKVVDWAAEENTDHLFFHWPIANQFWATIGLPLDDATSSRNWHILPRVRSIPHDQYGAFIALCCWQLWKRRNAQVFRDENLTLRQLLLSCKAEAALWRNRFPKKSKKAIDDWSRNLDTAVLSISNET